MCEHGNTIYMPVKGRVVNIDSCIHQIVAALNAGGLLTEACCCGHGKYHGNIILSDGRFLNIYKDRHSWELAEKILSKNIEEKHGKNYIPCKDVRENLTI